MQMKTQPYISFCTVCMNRLEHLQETLPLNIDLNKSYPSIEFVLLDYSSTDGLETWINTNLQEHLNSGILKYYKAFGYQHFDRSHSRNMMFKLAEGDIICNIDADNYMGNGFAQYIGDIFSKDPQSLIIPNEKLSYFNRDVIGKFCALKEDFLEVGGYDEEMNGYGFEDNDLYTRLQTLDRTVRFLDNPQFMKGIKHGDEKRIANEYFTTAIQSFYINYINTKKSEILILFKDKTYFTGFVIPNFHPTPAPVFIENYQWKKGNWLIDQDQFCFTSNRSLEKMELNQKDECLYNEDKKFHLITDPHFLDALKLSLPIITNQGIFLEKREQNQLTNINGFGQGIVTTIDQKEISLT